MKVVYILLFLAVCVGAGYLISHKPPQPAVKKRTPTNQPVPAISPNLQQPSPSDTTERLDSLKQKAKAEIERLDQVIKNAEAAIQDLKSSLARESRIAQENSDRVSSQRPGWMSASVYLTEVQDRIRRINEDIFEEQTRIRDAKVRQDELRNDPMRLLQQPPKPQPPSYSHYMPPQGLDTMPQTYLPPPSYFLNNLPPEGGLR